MNGRDPAAAADCPARTQAPGVMRAFRTMLALLAVLMGACGDRSRDSPRAAADRHPVLVFAAADLQAAFREILPLYGARRGTELDLVLGSTGTLTSQIEQGAPADLFFAANERFVERLDARGLIEDGTRRVYARGRLAVVWRTGAPPADGLAALADPAYRTIAIANPEHAPYGLAAREAVESLGFWEVLRPRLVYGENIVQTLQFVQTGNADAAIVALGLVLGAQPRDHAPIEESLHAPLRQAAGVIRGSPRSAEARDFLDFVMGREGQAILRRYGFEDPDS